MSRFLGVLLVAGCLMGCPLDTFFGVAALPDGTVKTDPNSPAHQIGQAVKDGGSGTPIGLAGAGFLALCNLYQAIRGRQVMKALAVTVQGVEEFAKSETGREVGAELKSRLGNMHSHENVGPLMSRVVKAVTGS
jgi:hypothetical protein